MTINKHPGNYVDGQPLQEFDFTDVSHIDLVEVAGKNTVLTIPKETLVYIGQILGTGSVEDPSTDSLDQQLGDIFPVMTGRILSIGTVMNEGRLVFIGGQEERQQRILNFERRMSLE